MIIVLARLGSSFRGSTYCLLDIYVVCRLALAIYDVTASGIQALDNKGPE